MEPSIRSRVRLGAAAIFLALLPSCFTTAVWGGSIHDHDDDGRSTIQPGEGPETDMSVWTRLCLTPFTIILDLCTLPVQAWLYGWDDDDDDEDDLGADDC